MSESLFSDFGSRDWATNSETTKWTLIGRFESKKRKWTHKNPTEKENDSNWSNQNEEIDDKHGTAGELADSIIVRLLSSEKWPFKNKMTIFFSGKMTWKFEMVSIILFKLPLTRLVICSDLVTHQFLVQLWVLGIIVQRWKVPKIEMNHVISPKKYKDQVKLNWDDIRAIQDLYDGPNMANQIKIRKIWMKIIRLLLQFLLPEYS